ncbi:MAG: chloride channel protein [Porphyromonas sp.]|uniref:chloride channel protein n=1 Tax=Porphyromonas sp. TaxID=1924944 RepID=UPI001CB3129F|nr:chloride channel protein [Porphyromonas sp.]MBF1303727.1 chloride channel protein [Porphyromonadaceae bacterium]MBF1371558.1 chloride channel protein [Porphyromonas sp.]
MSAFSQVITPLLDRLISWRERHISERYFLLILSLLIGVTMALVAALLKFIIHVVESFILQNIEDHHYLYLLFPALGILLSLLFVRYIVRDDISHGVTKVLSSISQRKSRIKPHNTWSSIIASALTISFGGSVGAESPIVLTGAAVGSNFGRLFRLEQRNLMLLIGCGVAGALGGVFKAPITGLVFVIEVLLLDLTMASVLPLLVSSVSAAAVAYVLSGKEILFQFIQTDPYHIERIPLMILLGVVCGLMSLYFSKTMFRFESELKRIKDFRLRYLISAAILSLLIFLFPPLYGEGYDSVNILLDGQYTQLLDGSIFEAFSNSYWVVFAFFLLTVLFKVFASVSTNSGGGCGGLFAPTLFMGGLTGFIFSYLVNYFSSLNVFISPKNYILLGMAGLIAGVMHAPLTGVFLIAELSGGYNLFLPLMLVSLTSFATIRIFMPHSIYSLRLAEQGKLLTHQKDTAVLTLMNLESVLERDFEVVSPDMTLGEMVSVISVSHRNSFPVVDERGVLVGIVELDNVRNIMFRPELYERYKVRKIMVTPEVKVSSATPMTEVMRLFDETKAWKMPVVDEEGRYLGFISKSAIFNSYREVLNCTFIGD